jgi:hypothetical protein
MKKHDDVQKTLLVCPNWGRMNYQCDARRESQADTDDETRFPDFETSGTESKFAGTRLQRGPAGLPPLTSISINRKKKRTNKDLHVSRT